MIHVAQVAEAVAGGSRKHVLDLLVGLDPDRFRQTVVYGKARDPGFGQTVAEVTAGRVEAIPWDVLRSVSPVADLRSYRFLRRVLRSRRFDIVHCHCGKAGLLGRLAARDLDVARVYTPHCFPFCMTARASVRAFFRSVERFAGRYTDRLIAVAPSEAEIAVTAGIVPAGKVVTIENGVDPQIFAVAIDRERKRAELGLAAQAPVLLSVGALRPQKGQRLLVEAVPLLAARHPHLQVLIAGEGRLRAMLEGLICRLNVGDRVHLLGAREDIAELLQVADCLVLPSVWEGGPYTLLEAMAAGTPVVGSRIPGVTDWVREGHTGRLAEPGNPASLADAIDQTLSRPEESRRMAAEAREMVLRRNTRERWLTDMAALYEELVASRNRPHP
jgi:glycosyltransferase involved in cell wall biosynthesis